MDQDQKRFIFDLYTNPETPGSYGSIKSFQNYLKSVDFEISNRQLSAILKELIPAITLQKPVNEKIERRKYLPGYLDEVRKGIYS